MWTKSYFLVLWSQPWCWCVQMCKSYQRRPHQVASEYFEPKQKNPKSFNWDALLILEGANFWLELARSSEPIWLRRTFNTCKFLVGAQLGANLAGNELSMTPQHNSAPERGLSACCRYTGYWCCKYTGLHSDANRLIIGGAYTLGCTVVQIHQLLVVNIHWLLAHLQALFSTSWITWLDVVDDKTGKKRAPKCIFSQFQLLPQESPSPVKACWWVAKKERVHIFWSKFHLWAGTWLAALLASWEHKKGRLGPVSRVEAAHPIVVHYS